MTTIETDICLDKKIAKSWTTEQVNVKERFDFWKEFVCHGILNADCCAGKSGALAFNGAVSVVEVGDIKFAELHSDPVLFKKTRYNLAEMKDDHLIIVMRMNDQTRYLLNSDHYLIGNRDINIYHAGREQTLAVEGHVNSITVQIPLHHLKKYTSEPERYNNIAVPSSSLYGKLLSSYIISLSGSASELDVDMKRRILDNFSQLLYLVVNENAAVSDIPEAQSLVHGSVRDQIIDFVKVNIADERLSPQYIADRFHMSVRTLYYLFDSYDVSIANLIRNQRIQAVAMDMLRYPCKQISELAYSYGFSNISHFSRVFRDMYGQSPRDYRKAHSTQLTF